MAHAHAALGASSSAIWLNCPEAGRALCSRKHSSKTTVYAAEGTAAHGLAETGILFGMDAVRNALGSTVKVESFEIEITQEMINAVEVYVSHVDKLTLPGDTRLVEGRVSLDGALWGNTSQTAPKESLFGTADVLLINEDGSEVAVVDYKHGAGIAVEADTTQALFYGAASVYAYAPKAQLVSVTIVQPRAYHEDGPIRTKTYTRLDVENFLTRVRHAVKDILSGAGGYSSGKWCRFCPVAGSCPELHQANMSVAKGEFMVAPAEQMPPKPSLLSGSEIGYVLDRKDDIKRWLDAIEQEAIRRLSSSEQVDGYKLVAKRGRKSWTENDFRKLHDGIVDLIGTKPAHDLVVRDIMSPAKAKDTLCPSDYDALVDNGLIQSVSSGVTLAPASDKRAAINVNDAAKRDFEALTYNE